MKLEHTIVYQDNPGTYIECARSNRPYIQNCLKLSLETDWPSGDQIIIHLDREAAEKLVAVLREAIGSSSEVSG
jgi:hypothetical protein